MRYLIDSSIWIHAAAGEAFVITFFHNIAGAERIGYSAISRLELFGFPDLKPQDEAKLRKLLHQHRRITFFTRDLGFYDRRLCHERYCLVCLASSKNEVAAFFRRFLGHTALMATASGCLLSLSRLGATNETYLRQHRTNRNEDC